MADDRRRPMLLLTGAGVLVTFIVLLFGDNLIGRLNSASAEAPAGVHAPTNSHTSVADNSVNCSPVITGSVVNDVNVSCEAE